MPASYATDNLWTLDQPCRISSSQLAPLIPIGLGTLHMESITGYVARLAQYHFLSVDNLLTYEIGPSMRAMGSTLDSQSIYRLFTNNYTFGQGTEDNFHNVQCLLLTLEQLSGYHELQQLNIFHNFCKLFAYNALSPFQQWCPQCLQEWKDNGCIIYTPVLWILDDSDFCIKHTDQELERKCPHCHGVFNLLTRHSSSGYCSLCHQWLGHAARSKEPKESFANSLDYLDGLISEGVDGQFWWLDNLDELTANTPNSFLPPKQHTLIR